MSLLDIADEDTCGMIADRGLGRIAFCSLAPGHHPDTPHQAWVSNIVTGCGRDVYWLGPWRDDTEKNPAYLESAESYALMEEWADRYHDFEPCEKHPNRKCREI